MFKSPGAIMENDGGTGTAGSHFERRYFLYEVMTSGVINSYRISNFSFNVLEASGWYMPNYTYAEPFYFGQGEGCNFINENCTAANNDFSEFCSVASRGCTAAVEEVVLVHLTLDQMDASICTQWLIMTVIVEMLQQMLDYQL